MTAVDVRAVRLGARLAAWRPGRRTLITLLACAAVVAYAALRGRDVLAHDDSNRVFRFFNSIRDWIDNNRDTSPFFLFFVNYIRLFISDLVSGIESALSGLGWMGTVALAGGLGGLLAGWRIALVSAAGFTFFGVLGLWQESMDTLALTLAAVALSLIIGIPLGIAVARTRWLRAALTPVLDVMQIMPTFAYLAPMTLFFQIGAPSATVATMIYAIPPAIRITALGIQEVSATSVEAAESLGSTRWQLLRKVQLPMAKRVIILGVNQTIMMALSMVVITALIDAPGLGQNIVKALESVDIGRAFDAGVAIVAMAIVLDRLTTGAAHRAEAAHRAGTAGRFPVPRWALALAVAALVGLATVLGRVLTVGQSFPTELGFSFARPVTTATNWVDLHFYHVTNGIKDGLTNWLLNPLQTVLTSSPWWLVLAAVFVTGVLVSGVRAACVAAGALVAIAALGLWQHSMETLTMVLVAIVLTMAVGLVLGVLAARHDRFASGLRPMLDAAQTMPSFVYLLPAVALFGPGRFTAVASAVIYAVPPVVRLVERGIRDVPDTVVEAAMSAGSTPRQLLWKVQLPIARQGLLVAANQGIVMVLAMVVVGGLLGGEALGLDVVAGFSQGPDFGKGLAAGIAIVLLGVLLDRLTQGAGRRRNSGARRTSGRTVTTTSITPTTITTPITPSPLEGTV
jgi:glycine betaine/proline transport system permease protein